MDDEQQHLLQQTFIRTINKNRPEKKKQQKQTNKTMDGWKRVYDQQSTENC